MTASFREFLLTKNESKFTLPSETTQKLRPPCAEWISDTGQEAAQDQDLREQKSKASAPYICSGTGRGSRPEPGNLPEPQKWGDSAGGAYLAKSWSRASFTGRTLETCKGAPGVCGDQQRGLEVGELLATQKSLSRGAARTGAHTGWNKNVATDFVIRGR